jgi:dTDP-4-dehydrorhamnose reductase
LGRELVRAAASRAIQLHGLPHADVDIADPSAVAATLARRNPQLVVNAAAYTKVDLAESHEAEARRANQTGPAVLAEACAVAKIPLLHISTDYVFDGAKHGAYVETDPVHPLNVYGRTKAAGEEAIRGTLKHHVIVRTAWVYSESGDNFLKTILRLAATREELRIVADQCGSPTSARELAEAILHVAPAWVRDSSLSGTYHFTASGVTTWHGFASRIVATAAPLTGRHPRVTPIRTEDYPTAALRPVNSQLDCCRFAKTFGLPPRPWTEAVDTTTKALLASGEAAQERIGHHVA